MTSCSTASWSPASIVRRMSSPGTPGSTVRSVSISGLPLASRSASTTFGSPASSVLVELLDAVLALALAIDEADEVRGERAVGAAAGLRIAPDDRTRRRCRRCPAVARGRSIASDRSGSRSRARTRYGRPVSRLPCSVGRGRLVEVELRGEEVGHPARSASVMCWAETIEPVARDARGEDHGAAAVVDLAAPARDLGAAVDLAPRALDELVALAELPVAEARRRARPRRRRTRSGAGAGGAPNRFDRAWRFAR